MRIALSLWILLPPAIQAVLLVLLVRRRLYRREMYPFFFVYTLYSVIVVIPRVIMAHNPAVYPLLFWGTEILYGVFALFALDEVFRKVFAFDYRKKRWMRCLFPVTIFAMNAGLLFWWRFVYTTPNHGHLNLLSSAWVAFNEGVHSIECILLALFMLLWAALGSKWRSYDYGILLGFCVSGLVNMTADMVRFKSGSGYEFWRTNVPGAIYVFACVIWLHGFWENYQPTPMSPEELRARFDQAKDSNQAIKLIHDWLHRKD